MGGEGVPVGALLLAGCVSSSLVVELLLAQLGVCTAAISQLVGCLVIVVHVSGGGVVSSVGGVIGGVIGRSAGGVFDGGVEVIVSRE